MKWSILLLSIILTNQLVEAEFDCQDSANCSCTIGLHGDYELTCPKGTFDTKLFAKIVPEKSVEILCSDTNKWEELNSLYGIKIGRVNTFAMRYCPLPTISFRELLDNLKITTISALAVIIRGNSSTNVLTRKHLEGLNEITKLNLNTNYLRELPEDLFHDTNNITWLDLKNNHIKLPKNIFRYIPKLDVLELGSNNLSYLEPGIFKNLNKLRLLNLWSNRLRNLSRSLFSDIPNLENLDINSNGLTNLPPDLFADLIKLKVINLSANNFTTLPQGLFLSNPNLEKVLINENRVALQTLPAGFLANLTNLQQIIIKGCNLVNLTEDFIAGSIALENLTLEKNALTTLPNNFFKDNKKLEKINLSNNQLIYLPDSLFRSTVQLKVLNLDYNNLTSLSDKIFESLTKLEMLNLSFNKLVQIGRDTFVRTNSLKTINLSNNKIKELQKRYDVIIDGSSTYSVFKDTSATLEALYLSHNSISEIYQDWIISMSRLQILDLSYNSLKNLSYASLSSVVANKLAMDLRYNEISEIDFFIAEELAKNKFDLNMTSQYDNGVRVAINGNPIICDCRAFDLVNYFRNQLAPEINYVVKLDGSDLSCAGDNEMRDKQVKSVDPKLLTCEDEQCPYNCTCEYRPYDKGFLVDCFERGFERLPFNMPSNEGRTKRYDHIELNLSHNRLEKIPSELGENFEAVTKINLSYNNIRALSLIPFSKNLTDINLDHNNISTIDSDTIKVLKNLTYLQKITLMNNPWNCECEAKSSIDFLFSISKQITDYNDLVCKNGEPLITKVNNVCTTASEYIGIASIVIGVSGVLIGAIITAYFRYQREIKVWLYAHRMCLWFVTEEELDKDKQYDAFVSYSSQDENFVVDKLVPGLENGPTKYKLCLHYRDWIVGDFIPNQIARSVEESRRTVVVLSPNFLESVWGRMEFRAAHSQALSEGRARVIVILYGDIGPTENLDPELKAYLSMNTYVKWGDPWFWDKLRYALPHPTELSKGLPLISQSTQKRIQRNEKLLNITDTTFNTSLTTPPADSKITDSIIIDTKPN